MLKKHEKDVVLEHSSLDISDDELLKTEQLMVTQ